MAGKKKVEKESSSWIGGIEKYSRQIWLAGLGAYSKISNDGNKLFDSLVKDGEHAEAQAKTEVDKQVDTVKSSAKSARSRVGDVKDKALGKWSELEEAFDTRLNSAISRLGVPSRNEVKSLHSKVDSLTRQLEKLTGQSAKAPAVKAVTANGASKPASKAAAKPAVKPAAKAPAASAAKPAAKSPAKAASKPAAKTAAAKPVAKAKTAVAKPVAAAKTATAKPVAAANTATAKPAAAAKPKPAARKPAAKKPVAAKSAVAASPTPPPTPTPEPTATPSAQS